MLDKMTMYGNLIQYNTVEAKSENNHSTDSLTHTTVINYGRQIIAFFTRDLHAQ